MPAGFLNIIPPGQQGTLNIVDTLSAALGSPPRNFVNQLAMYANLVHAVPGLTHAQLGAFFKDAYITQALLRPAGPARPVDAGRRGLNRYAFHRAQVD